MKNFKYTIEAIISDTHDKISNEVFDCVGTSIYQNTLTMLDKVLDIQYMIDISKIDLKKNK